MGGLTAAKAIVTAEPSADPAEEIADLGDADLRL
jgi:hypothetical protein